MTSASSVGKASNLFPADSEPVQAAEPLPFHRQTAAQALLAAIVAMQDAVDPRTLAEHAAGGVLRLTQASSAAVYVEGAHRDPIFATAGHFSVAEREHRRDALTKIAAAGKRVSGPLPGKPGTLAVSFHSDPVRGAVLVDRAALGFGDSEANSLGDLARLVGLTAAAICRRDSSRSTQRTETSVADVTRLEDSPSSGSFGGLIGVTPAIARVRDLARVAARSSSSVLIEGESGVGKEVLAQAIHASGNRHRQPFVAVLCAAIPRELLESELFGYEAGSFTGASRHGRPGKFELADGGTLLLDDIVDMPLDMQAKLLRVLQERVVTRLGGSPPRPVDIRILATSNRIVSDAVRAGLFRADLYYRLNVLNIRIPPLRERGEDIKPLAEHFLRKHAAAHGSRLRTIAAEALGSLKSHSWPGNVRELEHWIESEIHFARPEESCLDRLTREPAEVAPRPVPAIRTLRELERELYAGALADAGGDISRAARELGISRGKLYRKLHMYELLPRST